MGRNISEEMACALVKSRQYVKKILRIERADVSQYSTRHFVADLLDNEAIAQRTRDRILGHAGDVSRRYSRKGNSGSGGCRHQRNARITGRPRIEPLSLERHRRTFVACRTRSSRSRNFAPPLTPRRVQSSPLTLVVARFSLISRCTHRAHAAV